MADELELKVRFADEPDGLGTMFAELQSLTGDTCADVLRHALVLYRETLLQRSHGSRVFVLDRNWKPVCELR